MQILITSGSLHTGTIMLDSGSGGPPPGGGTTGHDPVVKIQPQPPKKPSWIARFLAWLKGLIK